MKTIKKIAQQDSSKKQKVKGVTPPDKDKMNLPPDTQAPHPGMQTSALPVPPSEFPTAHKKVQPQTPKGLNPPKPKVPKTSTLKTAGIADIPNYRPAKGDKRCGNCEYFKSGQCTKFDVKVREHMTCDVWSPRGT